MAEYIEREAVSKVITDIMSDCKINHKHRALNRNIRQIPTADVAEVRRGEWIKLDGDWKEQFTNRPLTIHQCSLCGMYYQNAPYRYCPNCGAKMDGRSEDIGNIL